MSEQVTVVDNESIPWVNGGEVFATMEPAFRDNLGEDPQRVQALLSKYGSIDAGFTAYDQVTAAQRKELSDAVNALAEPLSQLTHTVLGIAAG